MTWRTARRSRTYRHSSSVCGSRVLICGYDPLEGDRPHLVVPVRLMDRPYEQPRGDTCPLPRCDIQVGRATEVPVKA
jgi:hypothetical protein